MKRDDLVDALDDYLEIDSVEDASLNGLQVEGADEVERVALAVDAAAVTIEAAIGEAAQMLLVHHGLFWGDPVPVTGPMARKVGACLEEGLSIYAAHLPLDRHPEVGNNVLLARALGGEPEADFGEIGGVPIGVVARLTEPCDPGGLAGRLAATGCPEPLLWSFSEGDLETVAVVTGAGCSLLGEAAAAGADALVTGEPRHSAYHQARELGITCLFGGHYATETHGVRAVGKWLEREHGLETGWIDHPTGV